MFDASHDAGCQETSLGRHKGHLGKVLLYLELCHGIDKGTLVLST